MAPWPWSSLGGMWRRGALTFTEMAWAVELVSRFEIKDLILLELMAL